METLKKFAKKSLTDPKLPAQENFWSWARLCLADLKKSSKSQAEEATLVWQLVKASL